MIRLWVNGVDHEQTMSGTRRDTYLGGIYTRIYHPERYLGGYTRVSSSLINLSFSAQNGHFCSKREKYPPERAVFNKVQQ